MHNFEASGFPSPADDYLKPKLDLNAFLISRPAATFFMRVDCGQDARYGIHDQDILIVDKAEPMRRDAMAVAILDGEMLIMPVYKLPKRKLEIWGIATSVIHRF